MRPKSDKYNHTYMIKAAAKLAEKVGRDNIKFETLAKELEISRTIIYKLFDSTEALKDEILKYAIENEIVIILIEALIFNKIKKTSLSKEVRSKISNYFDSL